MREIADPRTNLKKHRCNAIDCEETIAPMRFMCVRHWMKVDTDGDRLDIMRGLRSIARGADPTEDWLHSALHAVMFVGYHEMRVGIEEFSAHNMDEWKRVDKQPYLFNERVADAGKKREPLPRHVSIDPRTGAFLRDARERAGFSLSTAANGVAMSVQALSAIESGDAGPLPINLANRLCRFVKIDLNELIAHSRRSSKTPAAK